MGGCPQTLFHPAVASWFARRFPAGPTPPQSAAWPHIAAGSDVLVASPTGSGKTLTGFLVAIDAALSRRRGGILRPGRARGPLHLAAAGACRRRAREPPRPPDRNPRGGGPARVPGSGAARRHPHGRHAGGRTCRHEEAVARPARHDAGVAVPPPHRALVARPPARRADRDRRRGAHVGARQAGQPPGAVAWSGWTRW